MMVVYVNKTLKRMMMMTMMMATPVMMMMTTRWEQVTKQELTDGHSHPVNKEPTTDFMPQVVTKITIYLDSSS